MTFRFLRRLRFGATALADVSLLVTASPASAATTLLNGSVLIDDGLAAGPVDPAGRGCLTHDS